MLGLGLGKPTPAPSGLAPTDPVGDRRCGGVFGGKLLLYVRFLVPSMRIGLDELVLQSRVKLSIDNDIINIVNTNLASTRNIDYTSSSSKVSTVSLSKQQQQSNYSN